MDAVRYANREMKKLCMHYTAVPLYNPSEISYQRGIKALSNRAHASLTLLVLFLQVQQIRRFGVMEFMEPAKQPPTRETNSSTGQGAGTLSGETI